MIIDRLLWGSRSHPTSKLLDSGFRPKGVAQNQSILSFCRANNIEDAPPTPPNMPPLIIVVATPKESPRVTPNTNMAVTAASTPAVKPLAIMRRFATKPAANPAITYRKYTVALIHGSNVSTFAAVFTMLFAAVVTTKNRTANKATAIARARSSIGGDLLSALS